MSAPELILCRSCGAKVLPPAHYCDACGAPLGPLASTPPKRSA